MEHTQRIQQLLDAKKKIFTEDEGEYVEFEEVQ